MTLDRFSVAPARADMWTEHAPQKPDRRPASVGRWGVSHWEAEMGTVLHAYLHREPDGRVRANLWSTTNAERLGVPHVDSHWDVVPADDESGAGDPTVGIALACAALGSRLLRLASEIHARQPLFTVRDLGGVDK